MMNTKTWSMCFIAILVKLCRKLQRECEYRPCGLIGRGPMETLNQDKEILVLPADKQQ